MDKKFIKILLAIFVFFVCVVAPGLMGILMLAFVAYVVSDIIIDHFFGDDE